MMLKIAIILVMLIDLLFDLFLTVLSAKQRKKPLPENVKGIYDDEKYAKWTEYSSEKNRIGTISSAISFVFLAILILTDIFPAVYSVLPENIYLAELIFCAGYAIVSTVISIPTDYISGVVIEKKYGMGSPSVGTFISDTVKNLILSFIIEAGLVLGCSFFYEKFGVWFFAVAFCVIALVMILISTFSLFFQKLFNKFTPLEDGELRERLVAMFEKEGFRIKQVYVMNASLRTKKVNAFCTGLGKFKEIALYDNLLENYTEDEIVAVFAHELMHFKKKDTRLMTVMSVFSLLPMMLALLLIVLIPGFNEAFGMTGTNFSLIITVLGAVYGPISTLVSLPVNAISRRLEYRADGYAKEIGAGEALASALKKISADNLSNLNPHPAVVVTEYSHPTLSQRLGRLE